MNGNANRGAVMLAVLGLIFLVYTLRLMYLQVLSPEYRLRADAVDLANVELYPSRGIIYDRNEHIYVENSPIYDVKFIPNDIYIPDTNLLVDLLGLTPEYIRNEIKRHNPIAAYQWQDLVTQLDEKTYSRFSEQMWQFGGIEIVTRPTRAYNFPAGAHFLGYINQVDSGDIKRSWARGDTSDYPYKGGDMIGKLGIERQYEHLLRGRKGEKVIMRDNFKREMGSYADGKYDKKPHAGKDIKIGIDGQLQLFGEQLMQNKRGSIVAIDPNTGEILAFVSAPSFDPNLLTGSDLGEHYFRLKNDPELPLVNRPLTAEYPPGSIFKMLQALAAMSEGVINENTHISCGGAWFRNKGKPACHGAHGSCSLPIGIKQSCNSFFAEVYYSFLNFRKFKNVGEAYQRWFAIMQKYGVGQKLGIDIPDEKSGLLPTKELYDKWYNGSWSALTVYSNSIGQGEILMTPLQMANTVAMIANLGHYYPPHFLVAQKERTGDWIEAPYGRVDVPGKKEHFQLVVDAMEQVVLSGTATRARIDSIAVCGKTGTVENKAGEDHSVFFAFAPKENPQIAVATIVENAGFGGTWAAPISALMMEYHLRDGQIRNDRKLQRILDARFEWEEKPEDSGENVENPEQGDANAAAPNPAPKNPAVNLKFGVPDKNVEEL